MYVNRRLSRAQEFLLYYGLPFCFAGLSVLFVEIEWLRREVMALKRGQQESLVLKAPYIEKAIDEILADRQPKTPTEPEYERQLRREAERDSAEEQDLKRVQIQLEQLLRERYPDDDYRCGMVVHLTMCNWVHDYLATPVGTGFYWVSPRLKAYYTAADKVLPPQAAIEDFQQHGDKPDADLKMRWQKISRLEGLVCVLKAQKKREQLGAETNDNK